ncbi:MAG TPA: FxsA family protein [Polyangiales bacterium]|nr:FxsA family protein [Polyangiales bacterium]
MAGFFFLFSLLPFVELWLLVRIGRLFGAPSVLAYVLTMIFVGGWLARNQGRRVLEQARAALQSGQVPEEGLLGGALVWIGAVLLIIPGVISDLLGVLCLIPITRRAIGARLQRALASRVQRGSVRVESVRWGGPSNGDVIDTVGEDVTEEDPRLR